MDKNKLVNMLAEVSNHLNNGLLPFWKTHGSDKEYGGFLTYFDKNGKPTGETIKTLVVQTRMIFTNSSVHRANFGEPFINIAQNGLDFLIKNFWDYKNGGWYWTCDRNGEPLNRSKLTYGQSFAIYALSEYGMASDDPRGIEWAVKTFDNLQKFAADNCYGGYYEFLEENWTKKKPGVYGGDRKSFDVHMHLMEAFTNLYEATKSQIYYDKTCEIIDLICSRILHPEFGTGTAQFGLDWTPKRQILFRDVWGHDRDVDNEEGRPLNNTSFGHNVEFAWLLNHSIKTLGLDKEKYKENMHKIYNHCYKYGIDWKMGGIFCEGSHDKGLVRERNKDFWQQAECLTGMLDAYLLFEDQKYLDAYENVHRFVMDYNINHNVGEWYPLLDENNKVLLDFMGDAWKSNYHTVRSMIQSEKRLSEIVKE